MATGPRSARSKKPPAVAPLIVTIFDEYRRASKLTFRERMAVLKPGRLFPPEIPLPNRASVGITEEGAEAIGRLTERYEFESSETRARVSKETYVKQVPRAVGDLIEAVRTAELDEETWPDQVSALFVSLLANRLRLVRSSGVEVIPCYVFDEDQKARAFEIGPVKFFARARWLKTLDRSVFRTDLIGKVWARKLSLESLREMAFSPTGDRPVQAAYHVAATLGRYPWVAAVSIADYDPVQSREKGAILASAALDSFGLLFDRRSAAALMSYGGERLPTGDRRLAYDPTHGVSAGSSFNKLGLGGPPGSANRAISDSKRFRAAAGHIFGRFDADLASGDASPLIERWVNAVHWYGQALREPSDFMAIVKYGCAIDILSAAAGNLKTMVDYAGAAFGRESDAEIPGLGLSLREVTNSVYNEGRSALVHGSSFGLLAEKSGERERADMLARQLLIAVTEPLAEVVSQNDRMLTLKSDEVRAFIPRLRAWAKKLVARSRRSAKTARFAGSS